MKTISSPEVFKCIPSAIRTASIKYVHYLYQTDWCSTNFTTVYAVYWQCVINFYPYDSWLSIQFLRLMLSGGHACTSVRPEHPRKSNLLLWLLGCKLRLRNMIQHMSKRNLGSKNMAHHGTPFSLLAQNDFILLQKWHKQPRTKVVVRLG